MDERLSDHHVLLMHINIQAPHHPVKFITPRKLKTLDMKQLKKEIADMNIKCAEIFDPNELVSLYNNGLTNILDKHAPKKKRKITVRNKTSWTSEEIRLDKRKKCRLERKWLWTKLTIDKQNFKDQRNRFNTLL